MGLSQDSGIKTSINYKHWAVALALGAIVATSNPVQAQEIPLSPPRILGNAYAINVLEGDLDGDGDSDLVYLSYVDDPIILTNEGSFTFTESVLPNLDGIVNNAALFDMDGDNDLDIFMKNGVESVGYTYQVWLNDGAGNFTSQPATLPPIQFDDNNVALGDLDGDGDADLVVEENNGDYYVKILFNDSFDFSVTNQALPGPFSPRSSLVFLLDVDGDTDLDIAFTSYNSGSYPLMVFRNNAGMFSTTDYEIGIYAGNAFDAEVDTLDIDNDGDTDLIASTFSYPNANF